MKRPAKQAQTHCSSSIHLEMASKEQNLSFLLTTKNEFLIETYGKRYSGIFFDADNLVQYQQNYRQNELIRI